MDVNLKKDWLDVLGNTVDQDLQVSKNPKIKIGVAEENPYIQAVLDNGRTYTLSMPKGMKKIPALAREFILSVPEGKKATKLDEKLRKAGVDSDHITLDSIKDLANGKNRELTDYAIKKYIIAKREDIRMTAGRESSPLNIADLESRSKGAYLMAHEMLKMGSKEFIKKSEVQQTVGGEDGPIFSKNKKKASVHVGGFELPLNIGNSLKNKLLVLAGSRVKTKFADQKMTVNINSLCKKLSLVDDDKKHFTDLFKSLSRAGNDERPVIEKEIVDIITHHSPRA